MNLLNVEIKKGEKQKWDKDVIETENAKGSVGRALRHSARSTGKESEIKLEQNVGKVKEVVLMLINDPCNKHSGNNQRGAGRDHQIICEQLLHLWFKSSSRGGKTGDGNTDSRTSSPSTGRSNYTVKLQDFPCNNTRARVRPCGRDARLSLFWLLRQGFQQCWKYRLEKCVIGE